MYFRRPQLSEYLSIVLFPQVFDLPYSNQVCVFFLKQYAFAALERPKEYSENFY